jgi:hypothetical protein
VNPGGGNVLVTGVARSLPDEQAAAESNSSAAAAANRAIQFDGDDSFACKGAGQFGRVSPFTVSLWVHPASHKPREVILHQSVAAEDAAFRGISLVLDDGEPVVSLIHFWPGNAIQVSSPHVVPIGQWTLITVTYDGSSHASGLKIYLNGQPVPLDIARDKLTRDIKYRAEWGDSNAGGVEFALGARFRDVGFKGGAVDELLVFNQELTPVEVAALVGQYVPPQGLRTSQERPDDASRFEHYLRRHDQAYQTAASELQTLRNDENEFVTKVRQIMTMAETKEPRPVFVLKRGAYDSPAEQVGANTPAGIFALPPDFPGNRLGLAKWMTDDRNPLVSRVAVNRFWAYLFGRGLVASVEDFGAQGQSPTHPELLDWLARDFMNHNWDVKRLCKQIVLSATYRQSSTPADPRTALADPDNIWLGRGTRYRLPAEQIRDNALAASGLLVPKLGGPSVMPYQPAGLWEEAGTGKSYQQAKGEGLYRRSIYTFWRRTSPPPTMITFDATGRETCTARRERTATPLQALVLLNDPQYIEAARVLSEKLIQQNPDSVVDRLKAAFRILTSRSASEKEMAVLQRLFDEQKSHFTAVPAKATELVSIGDAPRNEKIDAVEHAAMTVVVQALMNFDECVTKR